MLRNLALLTDSYKPSHWRQLPPGTSRVFSFFESRGGRYPAVVFFGLQYFLQEYVSRRVSVGDVEEARALYRAHFGADVFHVDGWMRIVERHGGRLPVEIKAVSEGSVVPTGNVLLTVENTDPELPWLTNYIESLLVQVWYPTTVATQSWYMRQTIAEYLERSGTPESLDFRLHDFGFRGSTSPESAALGGCAHLVNFKGTDTVPALILARDVYGCEDAIAGYSIPAAEHSTITSWGRGREADAYRHILEQFPTGLVAVVSDSYDVFAACRDLWGGALREQVLERDGGLVIRPDSGDPPEVLSRVLRILGDRFGDERNTKGYHVLHPKVRVIQGDGIDHAMIQRIYARVVDQEGWSADNLTFGSGGGLLQKVDRDTQRFAFKCSLATVDGVDVDVLKDPVTDPGKRSKAGRLALVCDDRGVYQTVRVEDLGARPNRLRTVFKDGWLAQAESLATIRARAALLPDPVEA